MENVFFMVGIGFIFLCLAILIGIAGIFGYIVYIAKKKLEVAPAKAHSKSNNSD